MRRRLGSLTAAIIASAIVLSAAGVLCPVAAQQAATPQSAETGYLFSVADVGVPLSDSLGDQGIYLRGGYVGDLLGNVGGGFKTGSLYSNEVKYGFDLDMERLASIPGASVHFLIDSRYGPNNFAEFTGSSVLTPDNAGPITTTRLTELSWDQNLFDDRLLLHAGRISAGWDFAQSFDYCQFVSAICANLSPWGWSANSNGNWWPLGTWGARATIKPTPQTYVRAGVYAVASNAYLKPGWPGDGWNWNSLTGAFLPVQIGYETDFDTDSHPRAYALGWFWDNSPYNDALYNTNNQPLPLAGGMPLQHRGRSSIYAQAQQMVWRVDDDTQRGLTLYAGALFNIAGIGEAKEYFLAAGIFKGPFAARPNDKLGLAATIVHFDPRFTGAINDQIIANGNSGTVSSREVTLELNYGMTLAPGVVFKPLVQYIANPDQVGASAPNSHVTHAWVTGFQFSTNFNDAFGLKPIARKN
jgi:porin